MIEEYNFPRKYTQRTVSLLYGLSGNRCAHPKCDNKIIAEPTDFDDEAVIGHIAHIHSCSSKGPRPFLNGKPEEKQINGFENLILLCRHHHGEIDAQENTFTVDAIREWKKSHLNKNLNTLNSSIPEDYQVQTFLGATFTIHNLDATLQQSDPLQITEKINPADAGDKEGFLTSTYHKLWFQTDSFTDFHLTTKNILPPARNGTRCTIVSAEYLNEPLNYIMLFNHATQEWKHMLDLNFRGPFILTESERITYFGGALFFSLIMTILRFSDYSDLHLYLLPFVIASMSIGFIKAKFREVKIKSFMIKVCNVINFT